MFLIKNTPRLNLVQQVLSPEDLEINPNYYTMTSTKNRRCHSAHFKSQLLRDCRPFFVVTRRTQNIDPSSVAARAWRLAFLFACCDIHLSHCVTTISRMFKSDKSKNQFGGLITFVLALLQQPAAPVSSTGLPSSCVTLIILILTMSNVSHVFLKCD